MTTTHNYTARVRQDNLQLKLRCGDFEIAENAKHPDSFLHRNICLRLFFALIMQCSVMVINQLCVCVSWCQGDGGRALPASVLFCSASYFLNLKCFHLESVDLILATDSSSAAYDFCPSLLFGLAYDGVHVRVCDCVCSGEGLAVSWGGGTECESKREREREEH